MPYFQENDRLLESELKALTLNYMLEKGHLSECDVISNEYLLRTSARRADIVISRNGELWAFEIKSEADSLSRLEGQISAYLGHFDKVIVVSASKHVSNIVRKVPKEVAVWEVRESRVVVVQRGRKQLQNCAGALVSLLKLPKLRSLLRQYDLELKSKKRKQIELLVRQYIPLRSLREAVLEEFNAKYSQTSKLFFQSLQGHKVSSHDLEELSVYKSANIIALDQSEELTKILAMFDNLSASYVETDVYQNVAIN